jgi:hypothetical protein
MLKFLARVLVGAPRSAYLDGKMLNKFGRLEDKSLERICSRCRIEVCLKRHRCGGFQIC